MKPGDGRFRSLPSGNPLGLAALLGFYLASCGGEPAAEVPRQANLAIALDAPVVEEEDSGSPPIDSIFTIIEDLSGDGEADSLELRIASPRIEDPFRWAVRIWVGGELVFEHEAVDSYWDQFFGEPGFAGTSGDREEDKAAYYFDYLPSNLFHRAQRVAESAIFDRNSPASVYQVVARELHERGVVDQDTVQEIIEQIVERLQAGTVVLMIPRSPGLSEFPRIYIKEVREFVPFVVW